MNDAISFFEKYGWKVFLGSLILGLGWIFLAEYVKNLGKVSSEWTIQRWRKIMSPLAIAWIILLICFVILSALTILNHFKAKETATQLGTPIPSPQTIPVSIRQFSPEQKNDLRNATTSIKKINGIKGDALVKKIEQVPNDFALAFAMFNGGGSAVPADVGSLIQKLNGLRDECEAFQHELFVDEKSVAKQYIAYDSDLKKILEPELINEILEDIKSQSDKILTPGLTVLSLRNKNYQTIENFIEHNRVQKVYTANLEPTFVTDQFRRSESATNKALYDLTERNIAPLTAAGEKLKDWLKKADERSNKLRAEVDESK